MQLEKTLINLRKTHLGFFNINDGYINLDLFKPGLICKYKNNGDIREYIINKNVNFENSSSGCFKFRYNSYFLYIFKDIINDRLKTFYKNYNLQLFVGDFNKIYEVR
jgi:hypothetical protein